MVIVRIGPNDVGVLKRILLKKSMLYNKNAVKKRIPLREESYKLARKYHPFRVGRNSMNYFRDVVKHKKTERSVVLGVLDSVYRTIAYDYQHEYRGTRNGENVWEDGCGQCNEINILIYGILRNMGIKTKWLLTKNPKKFGLFVDGLTDWGIHPFVNYKDMILDGVTGKYSFYNDKSFVGKQHVGFREFVAYYMDDFAYEIGVTHGEDGDFDRALKIADICLKIEPNYYPGHCTNGWVYGYMGEYDKAEKSFKKAIKIAPDLADVYSEFGEFLLEAGFKDRAIKELDTAIQKPTNDVQILHQIEKMVKPFDNGLFRIAKSRRKMMD